MANGATRSLQNLPPRRKLVQVILNNLLTGKSNAFGLGISLLCGFSLSGCYSGYYLTRTAPDAAEVHGRAHSRENGGFPVYLASITSKPPDDQTNIRYDLARKLVSTGLYPDVYVMSPPGVAIEARLDIETQPQDAQEAWNMVKMVLSGLTAFLLSPALPQTHDFDSVYTLRVIWPSKAGTIYSASCNAHSYATLDQYRDVQNLAKQLQESACLSSLVNRMSADYPKMIGGAVYIPPRGTTTSQVEQGHPSRMKNAPSPQDVCKVLGYEGNSKSFIDCMIGVN
jgi:hypothetical protein